MRNSKIADTNELLELFSKIEFSDDDKKLRQNLVKVAKYYCNNPRHQYHVISRFIYEKMKSGDDAIEFILSNIDSMLDYIYYNRRISEFLVKKAGFSCELNDITRSLEKLYDHVALEEERLVNNAEKMKQNSSQIEENVVNTFNSIVSSFQEKVDNVSNSLNANIITVVGLFSAIIFVFFGGITGLASVVTSIVSIKIKKDTIFPMIILLAVGFVLFNIIFLLLYSISKLTDRNIGCRVPGSIQSYYYVEDMAEYENTHYQLYGNNQPYGVDLWNGKYKYFSDRKKADKFAERKSRVGKILNFFWAIIKRIVLRFPYVFVIDCIFIFGIIYLYFQF